MWGEGGLNFFGNISILALRHLFPGELLQLEELPGPLLVDNMQDEVGQWTIMLQNPRQNFWQNYFVFQASKSYGSFPDRLYVILDGVVVFQVHTYI